MSDCSGGNRDLHYPLRRQRHMCIRDKNRASSRIDREENTTSTPEVNTASTRIDPEVDTASSPEVNTASSRIEPEVNTASSPEVNTVSVSYKHLRAHETEAALVCRLLLEKKNI